MFHNVEILSRFFSNCELGSGQANNSVSSKRMAPARRARREVGLDGDVQQATGSLQGAASASRHLPPASIRSLRYAVIALRVICLRRPLGHYAALSFVVRGKGMEHGEEISNFGLRIGDRQNWLTG